MDHEWVTCSHNIFQRMTIDITKTMRTHQEKKFKLFDDFIQRQKQWEALFRHIRCGKEIYKPSRASKRSSRYKDIKNKTANSFLFNNSCCRWRITRKIIREMGNMKWVTQQDKIAKALTMFNRILSVVRQMVKRFRINHQFNGFSESAKISVKVFPFRIVTFFTWTSLSESFINCYW